MLSIVQLKHQVQATMETSVMGSCTPAVVGNVLSILYPQKARCCSICFATKAAPGGSGQSPRGARPATQELYMYGVVYSVYCLTPLTRPPKNVELKSIGGLFRSVQDVREQDRDRV